MFSAAFLALAVSGAASCPAPPVRTADNRLLPPDFVHGSRWIAPAPGKLLAVMWAGRAVDGRFSVYAHGINPQTGINEKIMWVVPTRETKKAASWLRLEWRMGSTKFVQRVGPRDHKSYRQLRHPRIYPSVLRAPEPGCWRLRVRTGHISATMSVLVQPQPQPSS